MKKEVARKGNINEGGKVIKKQKGKEGRKTNGKRRKNK